MSTIRLAHITDTHLGYRTGKKIDPVTLRNARTVDFEEAFEWAIDDILRQRPDAVVHAGDVFENSRPTWHTLRHFVQQWQRIENAGIPSLIIAGNHDTPRLRTGGSAFSVLELALPNTTFVTGYEAEPDFSTFAGLRLYVQAVPHGALTSDDPPIPSTAPGRTSIMVVHGMVKGILAPGMQAEPGEEELDITLLDPEFDYIALGHYHMTMQPPGVVKGWYAGSTERNGWGDKDHIPGYGMVTLNGPGNSPEFIHIPYPDARPMIDLPRIYADSMRGREIADEVLRLIGENDPDEMARSMVRVTIWNAERGDKREAESILKREAAHLVWDLTIPKETNGFLASGDKPEPTQEFPDLRELFRQFVQSRTGTAFNERLAGVLSERGEAALIRALAAEQVVSPEGDELG